MLGSFRWHPNDETSDILLGLIYWASEAIQSLFKGQWIEYEEATSIFRERSEEEIANYTHSQYDHLLLLRTINKHYDLL